MLRCGFYFLWYVKSNDFAAQARYVQLIIKNDSSVRPQIAFGSPGTMWVRNRLGSSRLGSSENLSSEIIWYHRVPIPAHLGSSGTIWGHLGSAWVICHHLGSSELIWAQKLKYVSAKMQNSMFFVNFMWCFEGQVHQELYIPLDSAMPTTYGNSPRTS